MKKKIKGLLVCMLLMSIVISAAGKINVKKMQIEPEIILFDEDVPIWEDGYSWTYTGGFYIEQENIMLDIDFNEAYFGVIDDSSDSYTLVLGGDVRGELAMTDPPISISSDDIFGNIYITKSTLGFSKITLSMTGMLTMMGFPFPLPGTVDVTMTYNPDSIPIEFPLFIGNTWMTPTIDTSINVLITALGGIINDEFNHDATAGGIYAVCVDIEDVTAGTEIYSAYNISYGAMWIYYAPSVGNFVKIVPSDDTVNFNLEMIATSYPTPNSPLKPDTPSGPTQGSIGHSYEYQTIAIDPNDDQIKYGWDWNGDQIPEEWTEFYDSNVIITRTHTWTEQGNFEIRVKARDGNGLEGEWSDPLPVSMPRNRVIQNTLFLRFLEQLPLLQRFLTRIGLK